MFIFKLLLKLRSRLFGYFLAIIFSKNTFKIKVKNIKHPINLRKKSSDLLVFKSIILGNVYNINGLRPKLIIDCGANIGLTTVYWKNKYPESRIISIEPEKNNFNLLIENIKYYDNIIAINKGVWNKKCYLNIIDPNISNWAFKVKESKLKSDIESITMCELIEDENISIIDILKVDIEGAEKYIFNNDAHKWLPKVKLLIIEIHDKTSPGSAKAVFETVSKYDYSFHFHQGNYIFDFIH